MAKKQQDNLAELVWDDVELQELRLKDVISKFYPDGVLVELNNSIQFENILKDPTKRKLLSENENIINRFDDIELATRVRDRFCIDIDFFCAVVNFHDARYDENGILVMFKVAPEDEPVYLHQYFAADDGRTSLRFLIDGESKDAFLVLEDFEVREKDNGFDRSSSFMNLSEFHAIIHNFDPLVDEEQNILLVSFSKADKKCFIERVFEYNKMMVSKLLGYNFAKDYKDTSPKSSSKDNESATKDDTTPQSKVTEDDVNE